MRFFSIICASTHAAVCFPSFTPAAVAASAVPVRVAAAAATNNLLACRRLWQPAYDVGRCFRKKEEGKEQKGNLDELDEPPLFFPYGKRRRKRVAAAIPAEIVGLAWLVGWLVG